MGSLDKIKPNTREFDLWFERHNSPYFITQKLDGFRDKELEERILSRGGEIGNSVAIHGCTIVVGNGGEGGGDEAHIYQKVGNHYKPIQVLSGGIGFGWSVAIQGPTIVVGSGGESGGDKAHIYQLQS